MFRKLKNNDPDHLAKRRPRYAKLKIPFSKVPRFIKLPDHNETKYVMFIDDIIRANLPTIFPGYDIDSCYSIKISRDADLNIEDEFKGNLVSKIRDNVRKRKTGEPSRLLYDQAIPKDFLKKVQQFFNVDQEELVPGDRYHNLVDLHHFPNPQNPNLELKPPPPLRHAILEQTGSVFDALKREEILLHFPYHSYDYVIRFLIEAAFDPKVEEIKITQYRVARDSAVINALISAARNGKRVTVFVEVKARFDEEINLHAAERMEKAGVKIIYSIPGLKVHAKVALVLRKADNIPKRNYAYLSTGNFNERTARIYADHGFFTSDPEIIKELSNLFLFLESRDHSYSFKKLWVSQFNMEDNLTQHIQKEITNVQKGQKGHIILKMNGLQDPSMIKELYRASEAGVKIDLIVRGICCLVPNQPYSQNIRLKRLVDSYLEHARIWYFYNQGQEEVFLSSADWMKRNLHRRIETAFPIEDPSLKKQIIDILTLQLQDNAKACLINEKLENIPVSKDNHIIRAQYKTFDYLNGSFDIQSLKTIK